MKNVLQQNSVNRQRLIDGIAAIVQTTIFWFSFARNFMNGTEELDYSSIYYSVFQALTRIAKLV